MKRSLSASTATLAAIAVAAAVFAGGPLAAHEQGGGSGQAMGNHMGTGPGAMGPGAMGPGTGTGAHPGAGYGMGYGMHPGMTGHGMGYGMPPGMMGPGMTGHGMGYGMHSGMMGPGMMGQGHGYGTGYGYGAGPCGAGHAQGDRDLGVEDVTKMLQLRLEAWGNPRLKVGKVEAKDDDTIVAEIVTRDGALVDRLAIDRASGRQIRVE